MKCHDARNSMAEYVQGDLTGIDAENIKLHIDSCADCQKEYNAFVKSWEVLGEWKDVEPSYNFNARFRDLIANEEKSGIIRPPSIADRILDLFRQLFTFRVPAWSVAMLLVAALYLGHIMFPPTVVEKVVYKEAPPISVEVAELNFQAGGNSSDYLPSPYSVLENARNSTVRQESDVPEAIFENDQGIKRIDIDELIEKSGS
jgi:hypothetical protein